MNPAINLYEVVHRHPTHFGELHSYGQDVAMGLQPMNLCFTSSSSVARRKSTVRSLDVDSEIYAFDPLLCSGKCSVH